MEGSGKAAFCQRIGREKTQPTPWKRGEMQRFELRQSQSWSCSEYQRKGRWCSHGEPERAGQQREVQSVRGHQPPERQWKVKGKVRGKAGERQWEGSERQCECSGRSGKGSAKTGKWLPRPRRLARRFHNCGRSRAKREKREKERT